MNTLDLVIALTVVAAGIGGWRFGLVARLLAWCGVVAGFAIGIAFVSRVVTGFGGTSADDRVAVAALFLLASATLGQAAGLGASVLVHRSTRPLPKWDRSLGAVFGGVGVVVFVWMLIPSLELAAGWPARLAHRSPVVQLIDRVTPEQPSVFEVAGREIAQAPYPSVDPGGGAAVDVGKPPVSIARPFEDPVRRSVVEVSGEVCANVQRGSGWVAEPGIVVTNAHVIAGASQTRVEDVSGRPHTAEVVVYDPLRDLALLSVDGLDVDPLPLGDVTEFGVVFGYPAGGELEPAPARVVEQGPYRVRSVHGEWSERDVLVLVGATGAWLLRRAVRERSR